MIGLNPLKRKVLITTDEVIFHGSTDNKVDPRILLQSIIIAEVRFIQPLLGVLIYNAIADVKNKLVTADNKQELEDELNAGRSGREVITLHEGDYVNSDTYLSTIQQDLWNNHLHKIVAECVVYTAMPHNRSRFNDQGVMKNSPETIGGSSNSASVGLYELKDLMDRTMFHRVSPLVESMHAYLVNTGYPGYSWSDRAKPRSNSISLNMYDDEEKTTCKW